MLNSLWLAFIVSGQQRGFTFDEITADLEEPILMKDAPSTSKSVGRKED